MTREELIQSIYAAFKDVKLEDGIGLLEAEMIDYNYDRTEARNKDERDDWTKLLPIFYVNYAIEGWTFMDAKGIRFHLPCYLLQDLESLLYPWDNPLIYTLNNVENRQFNELKILNAAQRLVIIEFLKYKVEEFNTEDSNSDFIMEYQNAKNNFEKFIVTIN
ncbi:MAG TPA: hypothetical protein PK772_07215 [Chitinophagaceae bacterium]|nr:hypothetical protein [Chitinophagaceae bacterium]